MKMTARPQPADAGTVAAIGVLAALVVTVGHEAIGHGGVCLALGGRITRLSSSLFRCEVGSGLIDLGGPLMNLALALAAVLASRVFGAGRPALRLFLVLVAAFAAFWEGAYLVRAMLTGQGDLYFAWTSLVGPPTGAVRVAGAAAGLALYGAGVVVLNRGLSSLANPPGARRLGRIVWLAATGATVAAALFYRGGPGANLRDAVLEIGAASLPLLLVRGRAGQAADPPIRRLRAVVLLAVVAWAGFVLTQGRGLGS